MRAIIISILFFLCCACQSDSGDGDQRSSSESKYHFYFEGEPMEYPYIASGDLYAFDADTPSSPQLVASDATIVAANRLYERVNDRISVAGEIVLYSRDNQFYVVSSLAGERLESRQVSTLHFDQVCGLDIRGDSIERIRYIFYGNKSDSCNYGEDTWYMIHSNMSADEEPVTMPMKFLIDRQGVFDKSVKPLLVISEDRLVLYNADLENPRVVTTTDHREFLDVYVSSFYKDRNSLFITSGYKLHVYDYNTNKVTEEIFNGKMSGMAEGVDDYLLISDNQLYSMDGEGNTVLEMESLFESPGVINTHETRDYFVVENIKTGPESTYNFEVISLRKTDLQRTSLLNIVTGEWPKNRYFSTRLYMHYENAQEMTALTVKYDGTGLQTYPDTKWLGYVARGETGISTALPGNADGLATEILRLTKSDPQGEGFAGAQLAIHDLETGEHLRDLGVLPADITDIDTQRIYVSGTGLLSSRRGRYFDGIGDLFFVDFDKEDSLTRLTETPATFETMVFY